MWPFMAVSSCRRVLVFVVKTGLQRAVGRVLVHSEPGRQWLRLRKSECSTFCNRRSGCMAAPISFRTPLACRQRQTEASFFNVGSKAFQGVHMCFEIIPILNG